MGAASREVGSLLLGLYDDEGKLDHVGFTSTITNEERPALTKVLEALIAPPGFTGKARAGRAAGAPSARPNGSRSSQSSWSRCATIRSPATASATAPSSCASVLTRRRANAPSSRSRRRCSPKTSSFCSSEARSRVKLGPIELRCFAAWEGRRQQEPGAFAACFAVALATPVLAAEQFYVALDTSTK